MKPVNLAAQLAAAETELACVRMVLAQVKLDRDELRTLCAEMRIAAKLRADEPRSEGAKRRSWWRRRSRSNRESSA